MGTLATVAAVTAQAATSPGWRQVFTKHYGPANDYSGYTCVVALSGSDAWAFGAADESGGGAVQRPVAVHWNGRTWTASALPKSATDEIIAASAPAPNDIWAVTHLSGQILHFNGKGWSLVKTLPPVKSAAFPQLTGVVALSAKNVWVFGSSGFTLGWGTWHYNGKSWTLWHGNAADITDGSAVSATNIWAIGGLSGPQSAIVHYTGTWKLVTASALSGLSFDGIRALSATDVWASAVSSHNEAQSWLVHYDGHSWSKFGLPWKLSPEWGQIVSDGHGGLWLSTFANGASSNTSYEVHRTAKGAWSRTRVGAQFFGLAHIPGTASVWGAGDVIGTHSGNAVIWAYGPV